MLAGDEVITINGKDASTFRKLKTIVTLSTGEELDILVKRGGEQIMLTMVPHRVEEKDGIGGRMNGGHIGIGLQGPYVMTRYGPVDSLKYGVTEVGNTIATTGRYIGRIFTGKEDGKALGGPGRIAAMTGKVAIDAATADAPLMARLKAGILTLLSLGAALSVGLGVANLMPIPVLDGGHLVYYGYEAIAGRPLSERKQELGFKIGLAALLSLFVILSWNDIGYVQSLFS
jgi:regulator of sigma E protease